MLLLEAKGVLSTPSSRHVIVPRMTEQDGLSRAHPKVRQQAQGAESPPLIPLRRRRIVHGILRPGFGERRESQHQESDFRLIGIPRVREETLRPPARAVASARSLELLPPPFAQPAETVLPLRACTHVESFRAQHVQGDGLSSRPAEIGGRSDCRGDRFGRIGHKGRTRLRFLPKRLTGIRKIEPGCLRISRAGFRQQRPKNRSERQRRHRRPERRSHPHLPLNGPRCPRFIRNSWCLGVLVVYNVLS